MLNFLRTSVLVAALTALFMAVGYVVGGQSGMLIALAIAAATNAIGYWNADKLVLRMQNAREVDPQSSPDLHAMVAELSQRAGIPTPRLYLIDTDQPNAFATGRDPEHGAVAVSTGLLRYLEPREVAAVVAHELAHIKNRDTLTMTITATFAGAISMLAQFGMFFGSRNSRDNPLGPIGVLIAVIVAPIAAALVQMAVSRTREYEADRHGAAISGDPTRARLGADENLTDRFAYGQRFCRAEPGAGPYVHLQSALGAADGQSVRDAPGGREPYRAAAAHCRGNGRRPHRPQGAAAF